MLWGEIDRANMRSPSTISGESAFASQTATRSMSRSPITIRLRGNEMSLPNRGQRKVRPTHPGEMLREDFIPDYRLTIAGLEIGRASCRERVWIWGVGVFHSRLYR